MKSTDLCQAHVGGGHGVMPPSLWPCNKVLKPNFPSMISQANNGCSLLSLIPAKLLLLDVSCENIFALSLVTALTACSFSIKKCVKMSVFYVKNVKIRWRLGVSPPTVPPPLQNPGCATGQDSLT